MANIKISQLTPKGANLGASDLLEISEFNGSGYETKSITGQEIIDAASSGAAWGDITGTLSNQTDLQTELDLKQDTLVSGTNIKTINGTSVLGSGDLVVSGGGDGLKGTHAIIPLQSNKYTYNQVNASNATSGTVPANLILSAAYIPNQSYICQELSLYVNTAAAGGLGRIGVYDDNNGSPNNLIFESSDIDCSTSGYKSIVSDIDFVAGQIYWIAAHWNLSTINVRLVPNQGYIVLNTETIQGSARYNYGLSYTFGTGLPNPMVGQATTYYATIPFLSMKKL